ncbi:M28 family metallopeptidase [Tenacibaculum amylolyticum]|uniref:M28 family metallopeptidase n=1 Tax=Tenacibaculum amylolyticum TaxID=104269 RepID=UPI0038967D60
MKTIIALIFTVYLASLFLHKDTHINGTSEHLKIAELPEGIAHMQQRIVGQLSGKYALTNTVTLSSRWTPKERVLTQDYLKAIIHQLGLQPITHTYSYPNMNFGIDLLIEPFKGVNIYTVLPATVKSSEYIILGAHYDSGKRNAPGAIDNATGMALIYSVIKELQKVQHRKQHILMVFFDQEEEENIGSKAFIKLIQQKKWNITSVHCFDMIGWDADNDDAMEIYTASKSLENYYLKLADNLDKKILNITINPINYNNSSTDFDEFLKKDFNVIGAGECYYHRDTTPYKDTAKDTFETVNFSYLLSSSQFITSIIKNLIN